MNKSLLPLFAALALGTPGVHAAALSLDGIDDWAEITNAVGILPSGDAPFTIGAWINPTSIPLGGGNGGQITFWGTEGPTNNANGFRLRGVGGTRHYFWGNDHDENFPFPDITADPGPNGDGWHHLAVTYDGNQTIQYLNGAQLGAPRVAGAMSVADANHRVGARPGGEFFHGFIDELSVWGVALDGPSIAGGWNLPIDLNAPGVDQALIAYYNFESGMGTDLATLGGAQDLAGMNGIGVDQNAQAPIPEPSAGILALLGLGFLARRRR